MKTLHLAFTPIMALVGFTLAPASAHAASNGFLRGFLREFPTLIPIVLCLMGVFFLYAAYSNDDDAFDSWATNFIERIFGRTIVRALFVVLGLGILGAGLPSFAVTSSDSNAPTRIECGDPGTESFINDEGFCDCPEGFTWANEADETSVVCMAESYAPRGS